LSAFPGLTTAQRFGVATKEEKMAASGLYQLRDNHATSLLLHGDEDNTIAIRQSDH